MNTPRIAAAIALAGMLVFLATGIAAQGLRPELDWTRVPNSYYLIGPWGGMVRTGYYAMALALILLGVGAYRTLSPATRSAAPLLLFVAGGIALAVTALAHTDTWNRPPTLHGYVHGVAAQAAFLCTATAMLLQSWRLRGDAHWRGWFRPAFAWAAMCFVLLWVQAFWRALPRGLSQKLLILLILAWLLAAAWRLLRGPGRDEAGP
ncbi:hypothetical protein B0E52_09180 [Rhodanobacter sp. C06]|uniref:DUF998 domain-containing protein n=1 Tax=Rhodanobacter sp. C06 TaxID=1945854 RepID=UPI0009D6104F|nr:DUF998 domain-containing protein [Rhodanobacter sp. C06]OOG43119.1 hypothetical protein B0E52_09180 [Rhodanobacter sp. C06]